MSWRDDEIGWQYAGRVPGGPDDPFADAYLVGRLRQETLSLTWRADLILSPRLSVQAYLQPFASVGRRDRFQRLADPRSADPAHRFRPLGGGEAVHDPDAGTLTLDLDGDGDPSVVELPPATEGRSTAAWCCAGSTTPAPS